MDKEEVATTEPNHLVEKLDVPNEAPAFNLTALTSPPVTCVAELIDLFESLHFQDFASGIITQWAFRGQPRDFGTLVPSFQRQFSRRSIGTAEIIERRLIEAFRKHYADLKDRSTDMPRPEQIGLERDLRCLSVMQHYEIPTRLLDWTSNFWTAIYFACASEPGSQAELWCYDRQMFEAQRKNRWELTALMDHSENPGPEPRFLERRNDELIVELDPQITPRMKKQEAHHTVSSDVFGDHAPLIWALHTENPTLIPREFRRILIDGSCKSKALQFLADEKNITASTIFPDVVGLGRFLRWQFESLRTMLL